MYFRAMRIEEDGSSSYLRDVNIYLGDYKIVTDVKEATPHVLLFSHKEGYSSLSKFMYKHGFSFEFITKEDYDSYEEGL